MLALLGVFGVFMSDLLGQDSSSRASSVDRIRITGRNEIFKKRKSKLLSSHKSY